jgi:hypothetical protein
MLDADTKVRENGARYAVERVEPPPNPSAFELRVGVRVWRRYPTVRR